MKHVRTVTKSVNPENFVHWTLPALHGALDYFFRFIYGTENHPAHADEPEEHLKVRLVETGVRHNRWVRYDHTLMVETCPSVDRTGTRVVDGQRGIKINHIWYWTEGFRSRAGRSVEVRIDPWDVRACYVLLANKWHACISKLAGQLRGYSEIEIRYAFDELARKHGVKKKDLSPERIAEWVRVMDARNFDPQLRQQQAETRRIYDRLNMTAVEQRSDSVAVETASPAPLLPKNNTGVPKNTQPGITDVDVAINNRENTSESDDEYDLF